MTEYERIVRKELRVYCIKWVIFLACCTGIIIGLCYFAGRIERKKCYARYADFQPEYVGHVTGCMITVDEQRVPANTLRMAI